MKTYVIQLDPNDDVTSVRDKMSWAKTERILLVFPPHPRILSRPLDLRLLQRHAIALGAQLAVVARGQDLRLIARDTGFPIFPSISSAQRHGWQENPIPQKYRQRITRPDLLQMRKAAKPSEASWRGLFGFRFAFFSLGVLAILAILLIFVPSATIHLAPASRLQTLSFPAGASLDITTINLAGNLPARQASTVVERLKTIPTTGTVTIPEAGASGTVRFRNLTTSAQNIPAGTVVSTQDDPPVRFITTRAAALEAGVGKTVDVLVQAVQPGTSGNMPAGVLVAMEGELGTSLAVTNPAPLAGGTDHPGAIQTAADRSKLHSTLLAEILDECQTTILANLQPGDLYFPDSLAVTQTLTEAYFPAEGQPGDTLSLTLRLQCQAQYAAAYDLHALALIALGSDLPAGFAPISSDLTVQAEKAPVTASDGVTRWQVQAERLLQARLGPLAIARLAMGHRPAEAARRLTDALPLSAAPVIQMQPSWWPWLPLIPFRITVSGGQTQ